MKQRIQYTKERSLASLLAPPLFRPQCPPDSQIYVSGGRTFGKVVKMNSLAGVGQGLTIKTERGSTNRSKRGAADVVPRAVKK